MNFNKTVRWGYYDIVSYPAITDLHFSRQLGANFEHHVVGQHKGRRLVLSLSSLVAPGKNLLEKEDRH